MTTGLRIHENGGDVMNTDRSIIIGEAGGAAVLLCVACAERHPEGRTAPLAEVGFFAVDNDECPRCAKLGSRE